MTHFSEKDFESFIIQNHVIGFFEKPLTLKSGRQSNWYINWRTVTNDAYLLEALSNFVVAYLKDHFPECQSIFGVPEGATKTAVIAQLKWAREHNYRKGSHVLAMGRAKPKTSHGDPKDQFFLGVPKGPTVVLEDTSTTGGSLIKTIDQLLEHNVDVKMALVLSSRSEKDQNGKSLTTVFKEKYNGKIEFRSLSEAHNLLPLAVSEYTPSPNVINSLKNEFEKFGLKPLNLDTNT